MAFDEQTPLEAAVWRLDLLALMHKHDLAPTAAGVEFLDTPEGARLAEFAQELFECGARTGPQ